MPPLCVDVPGAALALGVGVSSIRKWIGDGLLPTVRFPSEKNSDEPSRRVLISVADLEAFVLRHRVTPNGGSQ